MKILVTGARGFIGKNLIVALKRRAGVDVVEYDLDSPAGLLEEGLARADVIYHLAGVNRPERVKEFTEGNFDLTRQVCDSLRRLDRTPLLLLSSSTQAALDNPYGLSKGQAEEAVFDFGRETGAPVFVFRLPGVFGKWCRPNYNSVVATFCYNVARGLPISISDSDKEIEIVYIDDVISSFLDCLDKLPHGCEYRDVSPSFIITLGDLAHQIKVFRDSRQTLLVPDSADPFEKRLYATYLSYLEQSNFAYPLMVRPDSRGELAELLKSVHFGQIFVSRTRPGVIRGNHYHETKAEKFAVLEGEAVIRFRNILENEVIEYPVSGRRFQVVDIPPGYIHSIENVGQTDLIVLFWSDEVFDSDRPDTYPMPVKLNL